MSAAHQFVEILDQQGLLESKVIAELRRQVAAKPDRIKPEAIAKLLVSKGQLSKFQASKLLDKLSPADDHQADDDVEELTDQTADGPAARTEDDELGLAPSADDELGLAPLPGDEPAPKPAKPQPKPAEKPAAKQPAAKQPAASSSRSKQRAAAGADVAKKPAVPDEELVELEEAVEMEVIDDHGLQPLDVGGLMPLDDGGLMPLDDGGLMPLDGGLEPLSGGLEPIDGGLDALGGFDSPMGGMDAGGLAPVGTGAAVAQRGKPQPKVKQATSAEAEEIRKRLAEQNKSVWDSKWLLIGSTMLMLICLAGVALWWSLTRGNEAERFMAAEDDYRAQSYTAAIKKYEDYLKNFPKGTDVSTARVRIGISKLRIAVEQSSDTEGALTTAKEVLPQIEGEEKISEARGELAALLPQIAEKLLGRADKAPATDEKQRLLTLVDGTTTLIENPVYIPKSLYKSQEVRISRIYEWRARIDREINRARALAAALDQIDAAVAKQDTNAAYEVRTTLLKRYPELETGGAVREATQKITDTQRDLVQVASEAIAPQTGDVAEKSDLNVVLAGQRGNGVAGLAGRIIYVLADGAAYGLSANDGNVLWRRYVGRNRVIHPQPVSVEPGADAIVSDVQRHEVVRVAATTGKPLWRLEIGEPFQTPQISGQQVFVATDAGRVLSIDVETGHSETQSSLPQTAAASPTFDTRRPYLYQCGNHSNIYVLAKDSLRCNEVFYLGHLPGTIAVPPVMSLGHLFVVDNSGPDYSTLHIIATDANGLKLKRPQEPIRLQGHVHVTPFLAGRRVIVMTDTGALYVYDVETTTPEKPVTEVLKETPKSFTKFLTYPFVDGTSLWKAGRSLAFYEIQYTRGQLKTNWIDFANDTFVVTPQRLDETLITVRRPYNATGYTVSAIHNSDKTLLWETDLSVPAGQICVDAETKKISSVSSRGALFAINAQTLKDGFAKPSAELSGGMTTMAFTDGVELGEGKWALVDPNAPGKVAVYDTTRTTRPLRLVTADLSAGKATSRPIAFAGGVIIPLDNGQVAHVDVSDGQHARPFQPPLEPNKKFIWRRPAVIADGKELVIADNRLKLYRLGISEQGQRHLRLLGEADVSAELVSPLASVGSLVFGVLRGGSGDILSTFKTSDLKTSKEWNLDGRVTWGPERVGDQILVLSDSEGLMCFDGSETLKWTKAFEHDTPVGSPVLVDGRIWFASVSGEVWGVDPETGTAQGSVSLGEPLASGPVPFATRLLLSGTDGVLHVILKPTADPSLSSR